jgi:hypothetical protein
MHFRPVTALVASYIILSVIHPACAEEVADQGHIRYLKDHYTVRMNADGLPRTERISLSVQLMTRASSS